MELLQAVFLGLIQGLTEFFPVSSSGHLILLPRFLGWGEHSLAFDAVLHLGTGLAALCYFRREWLRMLRSLVSDIRRTLYAIREKPSVTRKLESGSGQLLLLVLASLPAGIAGLLFNNFVETNLRSPQVVMGALVAVAVLMLLAERFRPRVSERTDLASALFTGFSQIFALVPGVSRSGITITAGLFCGLDRNSAARFSFLLATPIVLAAGLWGLLSSPLLVTDCWLLMAGFLFSFLFGLLAIKFFLKLLNRWGLVPFAIYRILLLLFIFHLMR